MIDRDPAERWQPDEAARHFDELVRLAREEGPQSVAGPSGDVVVMAGEEYRRLSHRRSGRLLVEALAASPYREIDIEPPRCPSPTRPPTSL